MRMFLAIVACKLLRFAGKLVGKGSSMPGKFALKICPDILARVQLPSHIIAVTGSNGKTSTVEMIAAILRAGGKTVVYNEEGSNQIEGVTHAGADPRVSHGPGAGGCAADRVRRAVRSPELPVLPPHGVRHHQSLPGPADPERPSGVGV